MKKILIGAIALLFVSVMIFISLSKNNENELDKLIKDNDEFFFEGDETTEPMSLEFIKDGEKYEAIMTKYKLEQKMLLYDIDEAKTNGNIYFENNELVIDVINNEFGEEAKLELSKNKISIKLPNSDTDIIFVAAKDSSKNEYIKGLNEKKDDYNKTLKEEYDDKVIEISKDLNKVTPNLEKFNEKIYSGISSMEEGVNLLEDRGERFKESIEEFISDDENKELCSKIVDCPLDFDEESIFITLDKDVNETLKETEEILKKAEKQIDAYSKIIDEYGFYSSDMVYPEELEALENEFTEVKKAFLEKEDEINIAKEKLENFISN